MHFQKPMGALHGDCTLKGKDKKDTRWANYKNNLLKKKLRAIPNTYN